jgi:hypothetical protein
MLELAHAFRVAAFLLHCLQLFTRYIALVGGLLPYSSPAALCAEGVITLYCVLPYPREDCHLCYSPG